MDVKLQVIHAMVNVVTWYRRRRVNIKSTFFPVNFFPATPASVNLKSLVHEHNKTGNTFLDNTDTWKKTIYYIHFHYIDKGTSIELKGGGGAMEFFGEKISVGKFN